VQDPGGGPAFAGHIPGRTILGLDGPVESRNDDAPKWLESRDTLGIAPLYARRMYTDGNNWVDGNDLWDGIALMDSHGVYPLPTVKVPGGSGPSGWQSVADGDEDAALAVCRNRLAQRRTANGGNGKPVNLGFEHEPHDPALSANDYASFRDMMIHLFAFFSGWDDTFTTYTPANDISDICAVSLTLNGVLINANGQWFPERDVICTPALVNAITKSHGVFGVDIYDGWHGSPNLTTGEPAGGNPVNSTDARFTRWRQYLTGIGIEHVIVPEMGVNSWLPTLQAVHAEIDAHQDFWSCVVYFNALGSFPYERLIPATYPVKFASTRGDIGGNQWTQECMNFFIGTMIPAYEGG
jgi:hypothetical protein